MINASTTLKNMIVNGCSFFNYVDVYLRDGTLIQLEPKDIMIGGFTMEDETTTGNGFEIGATVGKTATLRIANHNEQYSSYDFFKAFFYVYVCAEVNGQIERIRKGKYYVITPETEGDVITLSGVDSMYLFDKPYQGEIGFPATVRDILSDCCLACGVEIGFTEFHNYDFVVTYPPNEDCTYRQIVSWACQIVGYNARISNEDKLELVFWEIEEDEKTIIKGGNYGQTHPTAYYGGSFTDYETDTVIFGGDFFDYATTKETKYGRTKKLTVSTDSVLITGVKIKRQDYEQVAGSEEYLISVENNPFTVGLEEEILMMLSRRILGRTFRPFSAQILNNPLVEPFDVCSVVDRKGNQYFTYINSVSYSISGFTTIQCKATNPVRIESSYVSESAKAVVEERKNTKKELSTYDLAVQNMNMLAMNSMGFHTTYETLDDGSRITYLHDKPLISDSKIIYKQSIDGFFISVDGGESYTSGFDSEGNAIVNVLSAIGIQFDWARGGKLSLGGMNNINGQIYIYDQDNQLCGVINNAGIAIYSEVNQKQVLISPIVGFVERDATSGTFEGVIYDTTVNFETKVASDDTVENQLYSYQHTDVRKVTQIATREYEWTYHVYMTQYRYRISYQHDDSLFKNEWKPYTSYPTYTRSIRVQLPDNFKGKNVSISIENSGINYEKASQRRYLRKTYYYSNRSDGKYQYYEKADGTYWDTDWRDYMFNLGYGQAGIDADNYQGSLKVINLPSSETVYTDVISENNVKNMAITNYTLNYSYDSDNAIVTITGSAKYINYDISELMNIRVLAMY